MSIQTFDLKKTALDLNNMLHDVIVKGGIITPIGKNTYKYKNYLISKNQPAGWNVFFLDKNKKHLASTFLKVSAFAICKVYEKRQYNSIEEILRLDSIFEKNYIDSLFFKNTLTTTADLDRKDTALWRYEIVHLKAKEAKQKIDRIFYSSIA